uniref:RNA-dependent RNA polymerase n=1 Tax=Uromyces fabae virus TaxID=3069272 RepID=A0AA51UAV0_9VIRU|nr:putative RNA-dependent RNA polymerase [Uromyces fabae virus]
MRGRRRLLKEGVKKCVLSKVHDKATKFISKKWKVDDNLYDKFIKTNILYGGVSDSIDDDAFEWDIRLVKVRSNDRKANMQQIQIADYPGAYDYALAVSNNLFGGSFFNKILHAVLSSLELNQSNVRFKVDINRRTPEPIDKLNSIQRGTFKSVTNKTKLMLARASGIPAISMYDEVYKIRELLSSDQV